MSVYNLNFNLNIAIGTTEPSSAYQSNFFRSYDKFLHKSWSNFILIISTKHQLQNLNQTLTSNSWPNLASDFRPRFNLITSAKHQQQNTDQTSALWPNFSFQFCTKMSSTHFSASTSATVKTSTSCELASSHARVTSIKSTKQQWISECDCVTDKGS